MGVLKDFDCSTINYTKTVESSNPNCVIKSGMSYSGFCKSKDCASFNKSIVFNRGLGSFLVNEDIMGDIIKCPGCNSSFDMQSVNLYQCKAVVTVLDHNEEVEKYNPKGEEIVRIGSKKGMKMSASALLQVETTQPGQKCCLQ